MPAPEPTARMFNLHPRPRFQDGAHSLGYWYETRRTSMRIPSVVMAVDHRLHTLQVGLDARRPFTGSRNVSDRYPQKKSATHGKCDQSAADAILRKLQHDIWQYEGVNYTTQIHDRLSEFACTKYVRTFEFSLCSRS